MPEAESLRRLLGKSIDYAGLFPPCSLELGPALANQADYVRSPESWMLSAFVLPVARFGEAEPHLSQFSSHHPLRISALGAAKNSPSEFLEELKAVEAAIQALQTANNGALRIEQLEMAFPKEGASPSVLTEVQALAGRIGVPTFWEAPPKIADRTIELLAQANKAGKQPLGFKLRTGGVQADAFPGAIDIAVALVEASRRQVPIKFTAGLHHPLRQFRSEVKTKMHGFLNVLGAGVIAMEHNLSAEQLVPMLEEEKTEKFSFLDAAFSWRDWSVPTRRIEAHRKLVTSFGSCSFNEPREDLRKSGLLT